MTSPWKPPIIDDVRRIALPLTVSILALSWLLAQILNSCLLAALTVTASVALGCGAVPFERRQRPLSLAALAAAFLTLCLIFALHTMAPGPAVLKTQVAFLMLLAPVLPLVYALTFHATKSDGSDT